MILLLYQCMVGAFMGLNNPSFKKRAAIFIAYVYVATPLVRFPQRWAHFFYERQNSAEKITPTSRAHLLAGAKPGSLCSQKMRWRRNKARARIRRGRFSEPVC